MTTNYDFAANSLEIIKHIESVQKRMLMYNYSLQWMLWFIP